MKTTPILLILVLSLFAACTGEPELPVEEIRFHVSGMYCDGCVKAVTVELERLDGLSDVQVSLEDSSVVFKAPQNKIPTNQQLSELMEELGYTAIFELTESTL
jgi:copper chaperone